VSSSSVKRLKGGEDEPGTELVGWSQELWVRLEFRCWGGGICPWSELL